MQTYNWTYIGVKTTYTRYSARMHVTRLCSYFHFEDTSS